LRHRGGLQDLAEEARQQLLEDDYTDAQFYTWSGTAYIHSIIDGEVMNAADRGDVVKQKMYLI
jgi:hypothetical protein